MQQRTDWIDNLRALAILAIFLAHSSASWIKGFYEPWPYYDRYASQHYLISLIYLQSLLPPFFFILAGYLAARCLEQQSTWYFIRKRLLRIGLPLLIGLILFVFPSEALFMISRLFPPTFWQQQQGLPTAVIVEHLKTIINQYDVLTLLHYFDNTQVYWFLYYLLMFECLTWLLNPLLNKTQPWLSACFEKYHRLLFSYGLLPFGFPLLLSLLLPTPEHLSIATPVSFIPDSGAFFEFLSLYLGGMLLQRHPLLIERLSIHYDLNIMLGIFVCYSLFYLNYRDPASYLMVWRGQLTWSLYHLFLWLTLLGTVAGMYQYYNRANPFLRYFSDAAYWIYFIHIPLVIPLQAYLAPLTLNPILKYPLLLLLACCVVLLPYQVFVRRKTTNLTPNQA